MRIALVLASLALALAPGCGQLAKRLIQSDSPWLKLDAAASVALAATASKQEQGDDPLEVLCAAIAAAPSRFVVLDRLDGVSPARDPLPGLLEALARRGLDYEVVAQRGDDPVVVQALLARRGEEGSSLEPSVGRFHAQAPGAEQGWIAADLPQAPEGRRIVSASFATHDGALAAAQLRQLLSEALADDVPALLLGVPRALAVVVEQLSAAGFEDVAPHAAEPIFVRGASAHPAVASAPAPAVGLVLTFAD